MQSEHAKSDRNFFDSRIRSPKSSECSTKSDDLGRQISKSKHGMVSKFNMLSTAASSSNRTINGLDSDTAVKRRCLAPDARSAGVASLRGQTAVG